MKNKPLVVFTSLAAATAVALGAIIYSRMPGPENKPADLVVSQPTAPEKQPNVTAEKAPEAALVQPETKAEQPDVKAEQPAPEPAPAAPEQPKTEAKPTFDTVRVESEGSTLAAGHAAPGAEVTLKRNGEEVGRALANEDGDWVVVTEEPLPKGASELSIEQKAAAGPVMVSDQSIAVVVPDKPGERAMVALVEPGMPTQVLQKAETAPAPEAAPAEAASEESKTAATEQQAAVTESATKPEASTGDAVTKPSEPATAESATAQPTISEGSAQPPATEKPAETQTALADSSTEAEQPSPTPEPAPAVQPAPEVKSGMPVSLDAVDYNSAGDIVFSGSASPGSAVRVYVDNKPVGDSLAGASGKWAFAGTEKVTPGGHSLRIDQIDGGGKVLSRVELPFVREDAARVAEIIAPEPQPLEEPAKTADAVEPAPVVPDTKVIAAEPAVPEPTKTEQSETVAATADPTVENKADVPAQPATTTTDVAETEQPAAAQKPVAEPEQPPAKSDKPAAATEEPATTTGKTDATTSETAAATGEASSAAAEPEVQAEAADEPDTSAEPVHVESESSEAAKTAETTVAPQPKNGRVVIQPGNNLWKLSRVIYGKGLSYTVIYEANKQQIRNPDLIYPGQIFSTPNAVPPEMIDPKRHAPLTAEEGGTAVE